MPAAPDLIQPYVRVLPDGPSRTFLERLIRRHGLPGGRTRNNLHATIAHSSSPVSLSAVKFIVAPNRTYSSTVKSVELFLGDKHQNLVFELESEDLAKRNAAYEKVGCTSIHPTFRPHVTLWKDPFRASSLLNETTSLEALQTLQETLKAEIEAKPVTLMWQGEWIEPVK